MLGWVPTDVLGFMLQPPPRALSPELHTAWPSRTCPVVPLFAGNVNDVVRVTTLAIPVAPVSPFGPGAPVSPGGPTGPAAPFDPLLPGGPGGPAMSQDTRRLLFLHLLASHSAPLLFFDQPCSVLDLSAAAAQPAPTARRSTATKTAEPTARRRLSNIANRFILAILCSFDLWPSQSYAQTERPSFQTATSQLSPAISVGRCPNSSVLDSWAAGPRRAAPAAVSARVAR